MNVLMHQQQLGLNHYLVVNNQSFTLNNKRDALSDIAYCLPLDWVFSGADPGGPRGPGPPLTTKNEAPAPKFYKIEALEWQF